MAKSIKQMAALFAMLAAVGAPVLSLCRVSIGSLHLDSLNLKPGEWAPIRPDAL